MIPYFKIIKKSAISKARITELKTPHGIIHGPFFMPIATRGAVKNLTADELKELGAEIILSNTYHLLLNPGMDVMKKCRGLHKFMNWDGPLLTDSGGYQVFSLSDHREITEMSVKFRDPNNGKQYTITPEGAICIQDIIGSDIIMTFDECPPYPCSRAYAEESLKMTTRWAKRCKEEFRKTQNSPHPQSLSRKGRGGNSFFSPLPLAGEGGRRPGEGVGGKLLFGIVQGSIYKNLRIQSAKEIVKIGFDGYAIGGVAVGEPREKLKKVLEWAIPELPENKPRYLMGLGKPEEIVFAVQEGIDMFDCVIPTREARHGRLYLWRSKSYKLTANSFYQTININNAKFAKDLSPINNSNLKQYTKAYLHHLFRTNEPLAMRLATLNNLKFYLTLMRRIQEGIKKEG